MVSPKVEDDRLEDALALARSSLWPFTNEVVGDAQGLWMMTDGKSYGKIWEKYGKIWETMGKYGKIWENMGYERYNQWYKPGGESGCSMGFHHGEICLSGHPRGEVSRGKGTKMAIWRFPKMGVPLNHPFLFGIFHNHPAIKGYPHKFETSICN